MPENAAPTPPPTGARQAAPPRIGVLCPVCGERPIDTAASMVWGSGLVVTYRLLHRKVLGCNACARAELRRRAAHSALVGWLSLPALFVNPFLVLYNFVRGCSVRPNPRAVMQVFASVGVNAADGTPDLVQVGYALAAAMISADGAVNPQELKVAEHLGPRLFEGFDPRRLDELVGDPAELPSAPDQARLLRNLLSGEQKTSLFSFLFSIARADGQIDPEEKLLLRPIARNLGIDLDRWSAQVRGAGT